jgi:hypothetical protein
MENRSHGRIDIYITFKIDKLFKYEFRFRSRSRRTKERHSRFVQDISEGFHFKGETAPFSRPHLGHRYSYLPSRGPMIRFSFSTQSSPHFLHVSLSRSIVDDLSGRFKAPRREIRDSQREGRL